MSQAKIIQEIEEAGRNLETINIIYQEADNTNEGEREIEPYSFRPKDKKDYFFGWDLNKNGIRKFAIQRIESAKRTGRKFNPRFEVEFN